MTRLAVSSWGHFWKSLLKNTFALVCCLIYGSLCQGGIFIALHGYAGESYLTGLIPPLISSHTRAWSQEVRWLHGTVEVHRS